MRNVVIVDAVRTAIGKMGGALKNIEVDYLAASVIGEIVKRTTPDIDAVILGHVKQSSDQPNIARLALLRAGLQVEIPGYTVHRQCASGLQAIANATQEIMCGYADIIIAGGAESMSNAPYYLRKARYGYSAGNAELIDSNTESQPRAQPIDIYGKLTMGLTAENVAAMYNISRTEQDEFSLLSQEKAHKAIENCIFKEEIIPIETENGTFVTDEHPRQTSLNKLANLPAVFKKDGTVTAGNSSGRNDGASALLLMSEETAKKQGIQPQLKIITQSSVGVSPAIMGMGCVPATLKALQQANLSIKDIDLFEVNEAFASQALAVIKELKIDLREVNVNGGAIALGHPLGGTGAILMTKLFYEMKRRGARYGLVTLCVGGGQGQTMIVENVGG